MGANPCRFARPGENVEIIYEFEATTGFGRQTRCFRSGSTATEDDFVCPARPADTSLENEAKGAPRRGLGKHLSHKELLVRAGRPGHRSRHKFRLVDECARHQLLDLIGEQST